MASVMPFHPLPAPFGLNACLICIILSCVFCLGCMFKLISVNHSLLYIFSIQENIGLSESNLIIGGISCTHVTITWTSIMPRLVLSACFETDEWDYRLSEVFCMHALDNVFCCNLNAWMGTIEFMVMQTPCAVECVDSVQILGLIVARMIVEPGLTICRSHLTSLIHVDLFLEAALHQPKPHI